MLKYIQLEGARRNWWLATLLLVSVTTPGMIATAQSQEPGADTTPGFIVVRGTARQVPREVLQQPTPGLEVRLRAPLARHAQYEDQRLERARQQMSDPNTPAGGAEVILIPYGGSQPQGAIEPSEDAAPTDVNVVVIYDGGPLPIEAISPAPGVVVGLLAPGLPGGDEARASMGQVVPEQRVENIVDIAYATGDRPPQDLVMPPDVTLRLEAPPPGADEPTGEEFTFGEAEVETSDAGKVIYLRAP